MKKSVVLALAAALACGAASTAFAANPFSDVPADHWAYDAVAQLAEDGVIEGYGDGSYRGQQEITRFEMAQMIARAMAKNNSAAAQAQLDKLAAEFSQELNSLGVRVGALEKKIDNVKFFGELRHTFRRNIKENRGTNENYDYMQLRLHAAAKVNKHWTAKSAFYYSIDSPSKSANATLSEVNYLYAQGQYGNTTIDLGQFQNFEPVTEGMLWDDTFTGFRVTTGKDVKVSVMAARTRKGDYYSTENGDMQGINLMYKKDGFGFGAAYYHFSGGSGMIPTVGDTKASIWAASAQYRFNKDWRFYGTYAKNTSAEGAATKSNGDTGYAIELNYKGPKRGVAGTYGINVAYRHIGQAVGGQQSTYDYTPGCDVKGFEVSTEIMLEKNVRLDLGYWKGKTISTDKDYQRLHGRVHFYF